MTDLEVPSTKHRVPPLPEPAWTDEHRAALARNGIVAPPDPFVGSVLNVPEMLDAIIPMTSYVTDHSTLAADHRVLLALRTAWLDGSATIWDFHARAAASHSRATDLALGRGEIDPLGRTLLQFADELVLTMSVSDATWAELADEHDVHWLMDAVETVAHHSFLCCLARSFEPAVAPLSDLPDRPAPGHRAGAPTRARLEPVDGPGIAVHRTFDRHSAMNTARRPRAGYVNRVSPLTPHDRETLILRIGWDCNAEYEWAKHVGSVGHARGHGVDPELVAVGPTAPTVSDHDALLMRVADDLADRATVTDDTWNTLGERYDLRSVMSAIFTAASYRSTCMSLNAYGVQLEPGDEGFPAGHR